MCNKGIRIKNEKNNLQRPVTLKVVVASVLIISGILAPQILKVIYPHSDFLESITDGKGWYIYIGLLLIIAKFIDYKYFQKTKND